MVDEKFKKAEANVWECVAIAYSKCDAESKQWRQRMDPWAKVFNHRYLILFDQPLPPFQHPHTGQEEQAAGDERHHQDQVREL